MRPRSGEVLHFSEDPTIERFVPHVASTAVQPEPYVWAVDADQAPSYWFPRQCPRAMAWPLPESDAGDVAQLLGPGFDVGVRVHAIEHGWLEAMRCVELYAYRLASGPFRPFGSPRPHAMVATQPVEPLAPAEPVGDLLGLHEHAGIQLRLSDNLWPWWDRVVESSLGFSGIRLRNARPRSGH